VVWRFVLVGIVTIVLGVLVERYFGRNKKHWRGTTVCVL
jgi:hypothetical protein